MKREIAEKWVKALRSGEYPQGTGALHPAESFCCLGVLCDLARQEGIGFWHNGEFVENVATDPEASLGTLPNFVQEWAGIGSETGVFPTKKDPDDEDYQPSLELSMINDDGAPFVAIAAMIEANADVL